MNKIFVGQFVSPEESFLDKRISQAGNNYQLKLVEMLSPDLSISLYPIFLRSQTKTILNSEKVVVVNNQSIFSTSINKLHRLVFDTIEVLSVIKKLKIQHAFFYNIDRQNIFLIYLTQFLLRKKVYLVLADYPYFENKSFFDKLANNIIRKTNGVIALNSNIKVNKNRQVLPGLLKADQIKRNVKPFLANNVLLSGSLGVTTGLEIALETFSKRSDYNLLITGKPYHYTESEFDTLINSYTSRFGNIKYLGLLDYEDYIAVLEKCDIALSLRNPDDLEHQFNFPSKILEYLSKSKLVISSLTYKDLPEDFLFISGFDSVSLGHALDKIKATDVKIISKLREDIFIYLQREFTEVMLQSICNKLIQNG
jgi:hypothetical protein